jgi:beta-lactamase class A
MTLAACNRGLSVTASRTPPLDVEKLNRDVAVLAERARPGVLGAALINLESGQNWSWAGDRRFPMQSIFKAVLAAAALSEVDAKRLSLAEVVTLTDKQLSPPYSPIADAWPARNAYTIEELLNAAVTESDNTAADVLMKRIGGPGAVTGWLQAKRVEEIRIDRYERELQPDVYGMASFRPAWKGSAAFGAARATVAPESRARAMDAYMADPRDTATPRGMATFLSMLDAGELISATSTRRLLILMATLPGAADRLKAGLPQSARWAHKPGTSGTDQGLTPAFNDVGIFTLADHRSYAAAAFLTGSTADDKARAALLADLGKAFVAAVG